MTVADGVGWTLEELGELLAPSYDQPEVLTWIRVLQMGF